MGWFSDDSNPAQAYEQVTQRPHEAEWSHELIGGAAAYEAAKAYEDHVARNGQPDSHAKAKEILAGFVGAFVDREVETRGLDFIDAEKAKRHGRDHVEEQLTVDSWQLTLRIIDFVEMQRSLISNPLDKSHRGVSRRLGEKLHTIDGKLAENMCGSMGIGVKCLRNGTSNGLLDNLAESNVVGSACKTDGCDLDILSLEVLAEEIFDNIRTWRSAWACLFTCTVKDTEETARDHIEVDTVLLCTPPTKANLEVGREVLQSFGSLKNECCSGTIIIDTGSSLDRVEMSTEHDDILAITSLGLSKNVLCDSCFDSLNDLRKGFDRLSSFELSLESFARRLVDESCGNVIRANSGQSTCSQLGLVRVVDDNDGRTGSSGGLDFASKCGLVRTKTAFNENDLSLHIQALVVGNITCILTLGGVDKFSSDTLFRSAGCVGQSDRSESLVVDGDLSG
ncbi:hypothetical protein HG531_009185 [Fusarium graminearum]|nr:hypothetical protein HG531_009185 [Fusarium graminearum]